MDAERRYITLKNRIERTARWLTYKNQANESLYQELLSIGDLAFMVALDNKHKCKIRLDDWIMLNVQNAMKNFIVSERRKKAWIKPFFEGIDQEVYYTEDDCLLDLSEDAQLIANYLMYADGSKAIDQARSLLYELIGYDRYWNGIDELKIALDGMQ